MEECYAICYVHSSVICDLLYLSCYFVFLSGKLSIPQRPGSHSIIVLVLVNIVMQFLFSFFYNINYTFHKCPCYFLAIALVKYISIKYIPIDLQN